MVAGILIVPFVFVKDPTQLWLATLAVEIRGSIEVPVFKKPLSNQLPASYALMEVMPGAIDMVLP